MLLPDTLIHCRNGLKKAKTVNIGDEVLSAEGQYFPIISIEPIYSKIAKIGTQLGEYTCSIDSKWCVLKNLKGDYVSIPAKKLCLTDTLMFSQIGIPGTQLPLPEFIHSGHYSRNITIPKLTPDIAWFYGYLLGDGSVHSSKKKISFAVCKDSPITKNRIIEIIKRFNPDFTGKVYDYGGCWNIVFNSVQLNSYFKRFKQPYQPISIQDFMLQNTEEIRKSFLAGILDSDGSITHRNCNTVSTVYPGFAKECQTLISSLGIPSKLYTCPSKNSKKKDAHIVAITSAYFVKRFRNFVINTSEKMQRTNEFVNSRRIDRTFLIPKFLYPRGTSFQNYQEKFGKQPYVPIKLTKIKAIHKKSVFYDITLQDNNPIVAEGLLQK